MTTNVFKAILIGLLAGALLFFMPFFLFRVLVVILIITLLFRLFGFRQRWQGRYGGQGFWNNPLVLQRWCNMSDDERKIFKEKMEKEIFAGTSKNL
jgi:hypothetical protein